MAESTAGTEMMAQLLARTVALREARDLLRRIDATGKLRRSEFEAVLKIIDDALGEEPDKEQ
jgi:hypothetical protein